MGFWLLNMLCGWVLGNVLLNVAAGSTGGFLNETHRPTFLPSFEPTVSPTYMEIIPKIEYDALHDIFDSTDGENWKYDFDTENFGSVWNFTTYQNPCTHNWQGLTCQCANLTPGGSSLSCNIAEIVLSSQNLNGILPDSIGNFKNLTKLDIRNNQYLVGTLPSSIGNLSSLTNLTVGFVGMTGTLPVELGKLSLLIDLNIYETDISGSIPEEIYSLTELRNIVLSYNRLTGTLSLSVGCLTNLYNIDLNYNNLHGNIPLQLGQIPGIGYIALASNFFTGGIPPELFSDRLLYLELDSNENLNGTLPTEVQLATSMYYFSCAKCNLQGTIPVEFALCSNLSYMYLYGNSFTGSIPNNLTVNMTDLRRFRLFANQLTGELPLSLDVTYNPHIEVIDVANNYLSGTIASRFGNFTEMFQFSINSNLFSGVFQQSLLDLQLLDTLQMDSNVFTGPFPQFNQRFGITMEFTVNNNYLVGTVTDSICNTNFVQFSINNNFMSGTFPTCFTDQRQLANLTLNNNFFDGILPDIRDMQALQTFYAQQNFFSGSMNLLYVNHTKLVTLSFVDVSNNVLTGSLPEQLFINAIDTLQSFAAASNCISGSITELICSVKLLSFLDLDGLSTAKPCRQLILSHTISKSFVLKNQIIGGIPQCLFNMSNLNTLHISGNEIEWSFPDNFMPHKTLQSLSLSHNKVTGAIPTSIFTRTWTSLDLSYNKLDGEIADRIGLFQNSSLTLQVNRLSNNIPSAFRNFESISILNGNLFSCGPKRHTLPVHDKDYHTYQCGSSAFNNAMSVWFAMFCVVLVLFLVVLRVINNQKTVTAGHNRSLFLPYIMLHGPTQLVLLYYSYIMQTKKVLGEFVVTIAMFRHALLLSTGIITVLVLPVYLALSFYFKTLSNSYAYIISIAFLSGQTPAVVLLTLFMCWLCFLFALWFVSFEQRGSSDSRVMTKKVNYSPSNVSNPWSKRVVFWTINFINAVVVSVLNGGYVYIILNYNTNVIFLAQVSSALFKLLWNDFAVRLMVRLTRRLLLRITSVVADENENAHIAMEMPTVTFIVLFNTIIAPCLATAAVDPSCFVNVFVQPPPVSTTFPNFECKVFDVQIDNCYASSAETLLTISYDPPFIYSYQCTSAILTNYASVYVYMFLAVAFVKPLVIVLACRWYEYVPRGSILFIALDKTIYTLLKPVTDVINGNRVLFRKERFALRLLSKLAVFFLTFGVVFPPIAVVVCVAFYSETVVNEIIIGRFLCGIDDESLRAQCAERLKTNCKGVEMLILTPLIRLVIPFTAVFYAFFLLDIYGDQVGWKKALWVALVMTLTPALIWFCYLIYSIFEVKNSTNKPDVREIVVSLPDVVEMTEVKNTLHEENSERK